MITYECYIYEQNIIISEILEKEEVNGDLIQMDFTTSKTIKIVYSINELYQFIKEHNNNIFNFRWM